MANILIIGIMALHLAACSADLVVHKADPNKFQGIRVYTIANYKVTKVLTSAGCPKQTIETVLPLPADAYDITVDTSWFAKSEFTVMLADNGTLKQVTLNSTPQTADNINAAASLVKAIGDAIPKPPLGLLADCGATVENIVSIERLCDTDCKSEAPVNNGMGTGTSGVSPGATGTNGSGGMGMGLGASGNSSGFSKGTGASQ